MERNDFTRGVVLLQTAFGRQLGKAELELLFRLVADLEAEAWTAAVDHVLRTSRFFPSAAELREAALGSTADEAAEAWAQLQEDLRRGGRYRGVDLGPVGNAALRAVGGWRALCDARPADQRHLQRDFGEAYEQAARAARRGALAAHRSAPHAALSPGGGRLPDAEAAPTMALVRVLAGGGR